MPNCTRIKPKPYKICTGDLRYQITIKSRTKGATNSSAAEPDLTLTDIVTVWAMQKSINGDEIFNGTNMVAKITDEFYFRYIPSLIIDKSNIVAHNGELFNIEEIDLNVEGRRQFSMLKCSKRGTDTLSVNKLANV